MYLVPGLTQAHPLNICFDFVIKKRLFTWTRWQHILEL